MKIDQEDAIHGLMVLLTEGKVKLGSIVKRKFKIKGKTGPRKHRRAAINREPLFVNFYLTAKEGTDKDFCFDY